MTLLTVVTDTVKIFLLCQDIKYNKLRNKSDVCPSARSLSANSFECIHEKQHSKENYKTVSLIFMLVGARSESGEGLISCVVISP